MQNLRGLNINKSFAFNELTYDERSDYFEWMEILIQDGRIPEDLSEEEFMDKIYRMLECDQNQGSYYNPIDYFKISSPKT